MAQRHRLRKTVSLSSLSLARCMAGSLIQRSVLAVYCLTLTFLALLSAPTPQINFYHVFHILIGLVLALKAADLLISVLRSDFLPTGL